MTDFTPFIISGFNRIFDTICGVPDQVRADLLCEYIPIVNDDYRKWKKAFENGLSSLEWTWPWLEEWAGKLVEADERPHGYDAYISALISPPSMPPVAGDPPEVPNTPQQAARYLTIKEMRQILTVNGHLPKPLPRDRAEWVAYTAKVCDLEILLPTAMPHYNDMLSQYSNILITIDNWQEGAIEAQERNSARIEILIDTVHSAVWNAYRYSQGCDEPGWTLDFDDNEYVDPVGARLAAPFIAAVRNGEVLLPPFFPGDKSSIRWITSYQRRRMLREAGGS